MSILKLEPGTKATMTVKSADQVEGKFGPQIKFAGTTPDDPDAAIFLNVDPAFRQLDRIGFSVSSVIGQTVEFERVEKNGTKFTNINRTTPGQQYAKPAVQPHPVPAIPGPKTKQPVSLGGPLPWEQEDTRADALPTDKLDHLFRVYAKIEDHVLATSVGKFNAADVGTTPESVAAQIATLLIAAQKAGV